MKKNEGITLIALIITIVILIILTAVTINSITSSNLFGLAQKATENYIEAGKKEQEAINAIMSAVGGIGKEENSKPGESEPPSEGSGKLSDLVTSSNYGNYVDYPVDIDGNESETDYDWKIFYNDGTHIFIIADDYVPNTNTRLVDAISTEKANMKASGTYNAYWETVPGFETIGENILNLFMATGYTLTVSYDNSKCATQLLNTTNWSSFLDKPEGTGYGQYAIGGPTLEMWCESWNSFLEGYPFSVFKKIKTGKNGEIGYTLSSDAALDQNYLYMNGLATGFTEPEIEELKSIPSRYSLYFPILISSSPSQLVGYWLPSTECDLLTDNQSGGRVRSVERGYSVGGHWYNYEYNGLRPVVCLNDSVSATYDEENNVYHLTSN